MQRVPISQWRADQTASGSHDAGLSAVADAAASARAHAVVFCGTKSLCREYSLVLEAKGIEHHLERAKSLWTLAVDQTLLCSAYDELSRYQAELAAPRTMAAAVEAIPGAGIGAFGYAFILLITAYFAGIHLFRADWLSAGAVDPTAVHQWWRALTALTLHLDQEHLLGNLLFGVAAGTAAGRLLGPGVAWASILAAAAMGNYVEILIAPVDHRAVGASTAVFAALGLLAGLAWGQRRAWRERCWYRWSPLIAGASLLTLLGAGTEHVDVLGHALGFVFGITGGWLHARTGVPRIGSTRVQWLTGLSAAALICAAWILAIGRAA